MARSDLMRKLFASYSRGDDAGFRAVAAEIIRDERRKEHGLLANELEHALTSDLRPGAATPLTLRPLPKGRDDRPLLRLTKPERRFDDLVLPETTMTDLAEVVNENERRALLTGHGLRPRQRLLFVGPSGTGKSATAHAIAAELSLPAAVVSLPALSSSFLGETARNIESVVRFAEQTPCVLLFDEFDTIGQERSEPQDHGEVRRVVATVLQLLDDLHGESLVIATSNHPALLDSATWRRFDDVVPFAPLDTEGIARLVDLKWAAVRHELSSAYWADRLAGSAPAEVEIVCYDALRRMALSEADHLTNDMVKAAFERLESRRAVLSQLRG